MTTQPPFDSEPAKCPECGTSTVLPILYGTPSKEMTIASQLGQIIVRANPTDPIPPQWMCQDSECGYEFS
jgi:hypothetical protein